MTNYVNLRNKILKYAYSYYIDNTSLISDAEYDILFRELQELEKDKKDTITDKVRCGIQVLNKSNRIAHYPVMLSLSNAFTAKEFQDWCPDDESIELVRTPKLDGASLSLKYSNGILQYALRRGDGKLGDDITASAMVISNIPFTIDMLDDIVVRGEVVCPTFDEHFASMYKNQRNFVSGSLNLKDPKEVKNRKLVFIAYSLYGKQFTLYTEMLETLNTLGFTTVGDIDMVLTSVGDCSFDDMVTPSKVDLPTDGTVVSLNDMNLVEKLGNTSHHPRALIAVKPQAQIKETQILHVEFSVGKTGNITPVAILDPVTLNDTIVTRCTLHNFQEIRSLDVAINDTVKVMKSGFIIPKIIDVVHRPTNRIPIKISQCTSCGSTLVKNGAYLKCNNKKCTDIVVQQLYKFTKTARFMGFGTSVLSKLHSSGISKISDLLNCDYHFLEKVLKSEKIAEKLSQQLTERPKELTFVQTLASLNIPQVNEATAEKLLNAGFEDVFSLRSKENLQEVNGIGELKAAKISAFIYENQVELAKLYKLLPLKRTSRDIIKDTSSFIHIAITGKIKESRKMAKELLFTRGFILDNSIVKKTSILLIGKNPGKDKIQKAKLQGISTVYYDDSEFKSFI